MRCAPNSGVNRFSTPKSLCILHLRLKCHVEHIPRWEVKCTLLINAFYRQYVYSLLTSRKTAGI